jgi:hypothetical protein
MESLRESEFQGNDAQNADNGELKTFRVHKHFLCRKRSRLTSRRHPSLSMGNSPDQPHDFATPVLVPVQTVRLMFAQ